MSFIAVDLGTSFIKGAVLDLDARRIDHIRRIPFPEPIPGLPTLYREYDPDAILAAARALLDQLAPFAGNCEGLVMCSQMHGLVFCTERGEARSNLTTWLDQRVLMPHPSGRGTYFDVLMQHITPQEFRQLGNELRPGLPVGLLFWLAEQVQLPREDWIAASLPDFVLAHLGRTEPSIDTTNAMAHGVLNLETLDWHRTVMTKLGLDRVRWPRLRPHGEQVALVKMGSRTIPCYTPIGDYQCAMAGSLLRYGELSLNISTGSQVSLLKPQLEFGNYQMRPFFDGRFLATITHIPAGRALMALVKLLSELAQSQGVELSDPWPYITRAAAEVGRTDLRVDLAFFNSSCGDQGEIAHIREAELTVGHLFRAAFQNMADNYFACAQRLSPDRSWRNLVLAGGLAQKIEVLRDLIYEKFQAPIRLCPTSEDTMLGLMVLGLAFSGRAASVERAIADLFESFQS